MLFSIEKGENRPAQQRKEAIKLNQELKKILERTRSEEGYIVNSEYFLQNYLEEKISDIHIFFERNQVRHFFNTRSKWRKLS